MIFPQDVHKIIQDKGKIAGENKVQLFIVLFVLGNVVGFFLLSFIMSVLAPNAPHGSTILIHIILESIIGVFVFRFFVFNENEKKREYQGQQSDSFTRYMYIRKDNIVKSENNVNVFEYLDGSALFCLEMRFGSNDDSKAKGTQEFYKNFMHLASVYGFETRAIVKTEKFRTSEDFKKHLDVINNVESVEMRKTLLMMDSAVMEESEKYSNVDSVFFMVRSVYNYQKSDLEMMLRSFIKLLGESYTAFRSVKFLEFSDVLELYRDFYGIEAIDLAMMKAISLSSDISEDFAGVVSIMSLKGESGKTYKTRNENQAVRIIERQLN